MRVGLLRGECGCCLNRDFAAKAKPPLGAKPERRVIVLTYAVWIVLHRSTSLPATTREQAEAAEEGQHGAAGFGCGGERDDAPSRD